MFVWGDGFGFMFQNGLPSGVAPLPAFFLGIVTSFVCLPSVKIASVRAVEEAIAVLNRTVVATLGKLRLLVLRGG